MLRKKKDLSKLLLNINEVKARLKIISPTLQIKAKIFKGCFEKMGVRCKVCNYFWRLDWAKLSQGRGCPQCNKQNTIAKNTKHTIKDIENLCKENNIIINNPNAYKTIKSKLKMRCLICDHEWEGLVKLLFLRKSKNLSLCPNCNIIKQKQQLRIPLNTKLNLLSIKRPEIEIITAKYFNSIDKIEAKCKKCGNIFYPTYGNLIANKSGCYKCNIHAPLWEKDEFFNPFERKDRKLISPFELDFVNFQHKIAIELNGIYWHSELWGKDKNYHLAKTYKCEAKGFKLLHIYDFEWMEKRDIWCSVINNILGKSTKFYARDCYVCEILNADSFCKENHLQGRCPSAKLHLGLFSKDNKLLAVMQFGKPRYNKLYEWELLRFCSLLNHSIIGGASKLIKYFEIKYRPQSIISYGNRRWCSILNNVYQKCGFTLLYATKPAYFYIKGRNVYSRLKFQKHKLHKILNNFNPSQSERENMINNGYSRIWDCGNLVYVKEC